MAAFADDATTGSGRQRVGIDPTPCRLDCRLQSRPTWQKLDAQGILPHLVRQLILENADAVH